MDEAPCWLRRTATGWCLQVHAVPGAARTEAVGVHGEALKVRIAAPPVEGRANAALTDYLSECLNVPRRAVVVGLGMSGRSKRIDVAAPQLSAEQVVECLLPFSGAR
jgi:uncharacterized protein (TIGR00251 family)